MKIKKLINILLLFAAIICANICWASNSYEENNKADYQTYTCTIDGIERTYKLYLPANIKADVPLIFVLHGYGGNFNHDDKGFNEAADRHGFAVCYPQGSKDGRGKNCWNVGYPFQADMAVEILKANGVDAYVVGECVESDEPITIC